MSSKKTLKRPSLGELTAADCRACGRNCALNMFRVYATAPETLYMDFCVDCENRDGTLALYRRYGAYGTPEIADAVFAAGRVPEARRSPVQKLLLVEPASVIIPETREEVVQREIARREIARRRLIYFTQLMMPDYKAGWVHQDICRRLERFMERIEKGESPRLMLFLPPRAGKSQLASDMFPSWLLGHHPEWKVIASSYAQSLPIDFSRSIRDRLRSAEYQAIFPDTRIRKDAQGVEEWETVKGGGYKAAGVGVGLTGFGGHCLIMDDPIKDQEAADSELIRDNTFKWYQSVFRTRVAPGGGILVINTRWHYADPSGRLIDQEVEQIKAGVPEYERENWEIVSYPAIAEHDEYLMRDGTIGHDTPEDSVRLLRRRGEALHPERYPLNELKKIRNSSSSSIWNALYQQSPTPDDGDYFKKDDLKYRWLDPAYRPLCRVFITADYAIGTKQRNDFTVLAAFALDAEDNLYVLEIRRGRWSTFDIAANVVAMVERHKPEIYAGEQGAIHEAVWPAIKAALLANPATSRTFVSVNDTLVPITDKSVRARPLQIRTQRHKLFFSYDGDTRPDVYDAAEREMLRFPDGAHDDIVDALAWGSRLALNIALPRAQAPPKKHSSWKDQLKTLAAARSDHMAA
jgi:hypothetical protein